MANAEIASLENGTDRDSITNERGLADHYLTTAPDVFMCARDARHRAGPYWLTKRRDGRSANWMIGRYESDRRNVIYQSCRTEDLTQALSKLRDYAEANPASHPEPQQSRKCEHVYFIQAETGQIKIGIARNVADRMAALRTMSPVALRLIVVCTGGMPIEQAYHRQFKAHRLHGEWFAPHPDILAEIERLAVHPSHTEGAA